MNKILRDPLLHFLLMGAALFLGYSVVDASSSDRASDPRSIVVDDEVLLEFLQFRSQRFDRQWAESTLAAMTAEDTERLIASYTLQEAMYREALKLGLDENDYVIKRRLVRTLEFIASASSRANEPSLTEQDLRDAYESDLERYTDPPAVSFTHVFVASASEDDEGRQPAVELLDELRSKATAFEHAGEFGDRFLYQRNYVDKNAEEVASHFGPEFADNVFSLASQGALREWTGPLQSRHGWHLLLIDRYSLQRNRPLEEVRSQIAGKLLEDRRRAAQEAFARDLLAMYEVDLKIGGRP